MAKKIICYAAAFALLCVMFTTCYYFSYQSALKKFNEQSVKQDSDVFAGAAGNMEPDYEWSAAELMGEEQPASENTGMLSASAGTKEDAAAARVANFLKVSLDELRMFARVTGHEKLHELSVDDLCTVNREISEFTNIRHA